MAGFLSAQKVVKHDLHNCPGREPELRKNNLI